MTAISLKSYAESHNISYEAVRQQVTRYRKELENHIIQDGRQQFLTEEAVAFLDEKRCKSPVVIIQEDLRDELETTKETLERLKFEYAKMEGQVELLDRKLSEKENKLLLIGDAEARVKELATEKAKLEARAENAEGVTKALIEQADQAKAEAEDLRLELERLKKRNLWQRIWNKE